MKKRVLFLLPFLAGMSMLFASCSNNNAPSGGGESSKVWKEAKTADEFVAFLDEKTSELNENNILNEVITVKGKVTSSSYSSNHDSYTLVLESSEKPVKIYSAVLGEKVKTNDGYKNPNGMKGMEIVAEGYPQKFLEATGGVTYEIGYLDAIKSPTGEETSPKIIAVKGNPFVPEEGEYAIDVEDKTIAEVVALGQALPNTKGISEIGYRISGKVTNVGESEVVVADETGSIKVYNGSAIANAYMDYEVTFVGLVQNYYGTIELIGGEMLPLTLERYTAAKYTVTIIEEHGSTNANPGKTNLDWDTLVTLTPNPDEGYKIAAFDSDDVDLTIGPNLSNCRFRVRSNVTITVTYVDESETVEQTETKTFELKELLGPSTDTYQKDHQYKNESAKLDDNFTLESVGSYIHFNNVRLYYNNSRNTSINIVSASKIIRKIKIEAYTSNEGDEQVVNFMGGASYSDQVGSLKITSDKVNHTASADLTGDNMNVKISLGTKGPNLNINSLTITYVK